MSQEIRSTVATILALLAFALASCAPSDPARLVQSIWAVSDYTLADADVAGTWALHAGGQSGLAYVDTAARTLTIIDPDGAKLFFHYVQADYILAPDGTSHDVTMSLYDPAAGGVGLFGYNLSTGIFYFRYGPTWAAGTMTRASNTKNEVA